MDDWRISTLIIPPIYTYDSYLDDVKHRIRTFNQIAQERANTSKLKDKSTHDETAQEKSFIPGERALVKRFVTGPLDQRMDIVTVVKDSNTQNVIIKRNGKNQTIYKSYVFKYVAPRYNYPKKSKLFNHVKYFYFQGMQRNISHEVIIVLSTCSQHNNEQKLHPVYSLLTDTMFSVTLLNRLRAFAVTGNCTCGYQTTYVERL